MLTKIGFAGGCVYFLFRMLFGYSWIEKFENKDEEPKETVSNTKAKDNNPTTRIDDEILLTEENEDDVAEIIDEVETSESMWQQYMKNMKKKGFKRTTPVDQPEATKGATQPTNKIICKKCKFETTENGFCSVSPKYIKNRAWKGFCKPHTK